MNIGKLFLFAFKLANLELVVHVGIKFVVPSSQPEQNDLLWSVQFWRLSDWLESECCCFHFFIERVLMMVFSSV